MEYTSGNFTEASKASGEGTEILPKLVAKLQFVGEVKYLFLETSTQKETVAP